MKNIHEQPAAIRSLFVNEDGALSLVLVSTLLNNLRNVVLTDLSVSDMRQRVPEYMQCIQEVQTVGHWQFQSVIEPKGAFDPKIASAADQYKQQMFKNEKSFIYEFSGDGRHRIVSGPIEEVVRMRAKKQAEKLERERLKSESAEIKKQRAALKSQMERQQREHQQKEFQFTKQRDKVQSELDAKAKQLENEKIKIEENLHSIKKETENERAHIQMQRQNIDEELSRLNAEKEAMKAREEHLEVASVQMLKSKIQCLLQNGVVDWDKSEGARIIAFCDQVSGRYESWNVPLF